MFVFTAMMYDPIYDYIDLDDCEIFSQKEHAESYRRTYFEDLILRHFENDFSASELSSKSDDEIEVLVAKHIGNRRLNIYVTEKDELEHMLAQKLK